MSKITYMGEPWIEKKRIVRKSPRNAKGQFTIRGFLRQVGESLRRAVRWIVIKTMYGAAVFLVLAGVYLYGEASAKTISATNVIVQQQATGIAPVLHRIAVAGSGDQQFGKDGQVIVHVNSNNTYDIGRYQINSIWNETASKMGYNLMVEKDNEAFAKYLFENKGSGPWSSSSARWNK